MINTFNLMWTIGKLFVESFFEIPVAFNTADPTKCQDLALGLTIAADFATTFDDNIKNIGSSQKVYVMSCPTSIIKFPKVITSFMISTNEYSQNWSDGTAIVVLVKLPKFLVFLRHGDRAHVCSISEWLEVTAAQDEVYFLARWFLMI